MGSSSTYAKVRIRGDKSPLVWFGNWHNAGIRLLTRKRIRIRACEQTYYFIKKKYSSLLWWIRLIQIKRLWQSPRKNGALPKLIFTKVIMSDTLVLYLVCCVCHNQRWLPNLEPVRGKLTWKFHESQCFGKRKTRDKLENLILAQISENGVGERFKNLVFISTFRSLSARGRDDHL